MKRWGALGKQILSGWQINGITDIRSGYPITVLSGIDSNFDGNNTDRPDLVGDPRLDTHRSRSRLISQYLNTGAFRAASGLYGTAGRNLIYGPGSCSDSAAGCKRFS